MIYTLVLVAVASGSVTTNVKPLVPQATLEDCQNIGKQTTVTMRKTADDATYVCLYGKRD